MTCCFFGNRNSPKIIIGKIKDAIVDLIENHNVDHFYVGNQGNFDEFVYEQLKLLKIFYPHITYKVVLAYEPNPFGKLANNPDFVYPEKLKRSAKGSSAIPIRNRLMIQHSDFVICYTPYKGNASYFVDVARKQQKIIIDLTKFSEKYV